MLPGIYAWTNYIYKDTSLKKKPPENIDDGYN